MNEVRVTRTKEDARAGYDTMSRFYDLMTRSENKFIKCGLEMLSVRPGERVLEIGYGTGGALAELARSVGRSGFICGIDISGGMASVARRKLERAGLVEGVELDVGDAVRLPYGDAAFDAAFMSFALELFDTPEIPVVLGECYRVLAEGGRISVVAISCLGRQGAMSKAYLWSHRHFPKYVDCRPIGAARSLEEASFEVREEKLESMWRLPVEIVLAAR
jgi:ubiquinone/menaquinone biosynthesis C-methylase UbiE